MSFQKHLSTLAAVCVLAATAAGVTSCTGFDPYAGLQVPMPTAPASVFQGGKPISPIPHYWQLAALDAWQSTVSQAEHSALKGAIK